MPATHLLPDFGPPAPRPVPPPPAPGPAPEAPARVRAWRAAGVLPWAACALAAALALYLFALHRGWLDGSGPAPGPAPGPASATRAAAAETGGDFLETWSARLREAAATLRSGGDPLKATADLTEGWAKDRTAAGQKRLVPLEPPDPGPAPTPAQREAYAAYLDEMAAGAADAARAVRDRRPAK